MSVFILSAGLFPLSGGRGCPYTQAKRGKGEATTSYKARISKYTKVHMYRGYCLPIAHVVIKYFRGLI